MEKNYITGVLTVNYAQNVAKGGKTNTSGMAVYVHDVDSNLMIGVKTAKSAQNAVQFKTTSIIGKVADVLSAGRSETKDMSGPRIVKSVLYVAGSVRKLTIGKMVNV